MNNSTELKKNIKDSLFTGLIALAIFGPIVGLRTRLQKEGLYIDPQWMMVIFLVIGSAVGRFLINLNTSRTVEIPFVKTVKLNISNYFSNKGKQLAVTGVLFAAAYPFLPFTDRYMLDVGIMVLTYIMLGWGLNIVVGLAGLLDLGYVAFYAVGAYSFCFVINYFWMVILDLFAVSGNFCCILWNFIRLSSFKT